MRIVLAPTGEMWRPALRAGQLGGRGAGALRGAISCHGRGGAPADEDHVTGSTLDRCVVLLSGGLDSATVLAIAVRERGLQASCLSFDYGQRHRIELDRAARLAEALGAWRWRVVRLDRGIVEGSALTGTGDVPRDRRLDDASIPPTYVPARNAIFLAHALAEAERVGAERIFIGANAVDYSGYPDCRPAFLQAFERMANLATRAGVLGEACFAVEAPLLYLTKGQIVRRGLDLGVDFAHTSSCYDPDAAGRPCFACDACRIRAKGFAEAGVPDPLAVPLTTSGDAGGRLP
jgi:7-cyano-7-deazaguanine synthase